MLIKDDQQDIDFKFIDGFFEEEKVEEQRLSEEDKKRHDRQKHLAEIRRVGTEKFERPEVKAFFEDLDWLERRFRYFYLHRLACKFNYRPCNKD